MSKLIIHEIDCHGSGYVYFNGKTHSYNYDDGGFGDVRATVLELINIGFINPKDVFIFDETSDFDIYRALDIAIENGLIAQNVIKED